MKILKLCTTLISFGIVVLGVLGIAFPSVLLELVQSLLLPPALYWVAAVRIAFGVLLLAVAGESRMPRALRVIGAFIVVAGMLTPFLGVLPFDKAIAWFSKQGLGLFRLVATLPVIAGVFFVYAINPARPSGGDGAV